MARPLSKPILDSLRGPTEPTAPARPVEHEALTRLHGSGYLALRDVTCWVRDGSLHLRGSLPSYYLKQVAQAVVVDLEGVDDIVNQIQVIAGPSPLEG